VRFAADSDLRDTIENTSSLLDNSRRRPFAEGAEKKIRKVTNKVVQIVTGPAIIDVITRELGAGIHFQHEILGTEAVHNLIGLDLLRTGN